MSRGSTAVVCTLSGVYVRIREFKINKISTSRLKHGDPDAEQGRDADRETKKNSQKKQTPSRLIDQERNQTK